jgi:palmitoyl-protein thioesterase
VERCNTPPVRNLITWGSQHNGIADLPECDDGDFWCKAAFGLLKRNLWTSYVRNNLVQAQYYRVTPPCFWGINWGVLES